MVMVGGIIGVVFDCYRVLKGKINLQRITTDIYDLLFSILATLIIFIVLVLSNGGEIRIYIFLGLVIGELIYYFTVSKFMIIFFGRLFTFIYITVSKVKQLVNAVYYRLKLIVTKLSNSVIKLFNK